MIFGPPHPMAGMPGTQYTAAGSGPWAMGMPPMALWPPGVVGAPLPVPMATPHGVSRMSPAPPGAGPVEALPRVIASLWDGSLAAWTGAPSAAPARKVPQPSEQEQVAAAREKLERLSRLLSARER